MLVTIAVQDVCQVSLEVKSHVGDYRGTRCVLGFAGGWKPKVSVDITQGEFTIKGCKKLVSKLLPNDDTKIMWIFLMVLQGLGGEWHNDAAKVRYEYNHVLPVQHPEQNRDSSYKELSPTQEQQQQESNTKSFKNRQPQNDLSSLGFRQPETNPTVKIQDEQVNNTSAKDQLNQRRSNHRIYQTLKTTLLKNCDNQIH
ncbi:hypothetical protein F2Q69_00030574 [Brassica cretica]|uniref:Uncharacterized protein n=1 Tax=Brassica cretica TaxID=69181 RepID=A0A8S9S045_BRACR|nr:hypothetical protein F2Q69_00030574 [Brassica cretica]